LTTPLRGVGICLRPTTCREGTTLAVIEGTIPRRYTVKSRDHTFKKGDYIAKRRNACIRRTGQDGRSTDRTGVPQEAPRSDIQKDLTRHASATHTRALEKRQSNIQAGEKEGWATTVLGPGVVQPRGGMLWPSAWSGFIRLKDELDRFDPREPQEELMR
jgi:hypothetical protein